MPMTLFRLLFVWVALLTFVPAASAQQQPDRDWQACAQEADRDRSIRGCTAVLGRGNGENAANRAIALTNRGNAHYDRGNLDAAMADYNVAIRLNPRYASAFAARGDVHHDRGNLDAAMADYNQAIRINPRNAGAFIGRGNLHFVRGNLDAALTDYNAAIRINPREAISYLNRGRTHAERGNLDAAMADYNEAIRLNPSDALPFADRDSIHHNRGNLEAALADYRQAASLGHQESTATVALLERQMADARAFQELQTCVQTTQDRPRQIAACNAWLPRGIGVPAERAMAFASRGEARRELGNFAEAMVDLSEAIRLNPHARAALQTRGLLHRDRGDLRAAQADLRRAVELGATSARAELDDLDRRLVGSATTPNTQVAATPAPRPTPPPAVQTAERRVALVIGNAAYRAAGVAPLPNPPRDAQAMAALFRDLGFAHVALHQDLDQAGMLRALRDFEREAEQPAMASR